MYLFRLCFFFFSFSFMVICSTVLLLVFFFFLPAIFRARIAEKPPLFRNYAQRIHISSNYVAFIAFNWVFMLLFFHFHASSPPHTLKLFSNSAIYWCLFWEYNLFSFQQHRDNGINIQRRYSGWCSGWLLAIEKIRNHCSNSLPILFFVLFLPFSLFAYNKTTATTNIKFQTNFNYAIN